MSYSITRFVTEDFNNIDVREEYKPDFDIMKTELIFNEIFTNGALFFTLRYNTEIIAIYGFSYGGLGTYFPCVVMSKQGHKHVRKIVKCFYEYFALYVPTNCRRMEAYCDIMDKKAIRLASFFGFSIIGLRHYATAKGHDQIILERLLCMDHRKIKK